MLEMGFIVVYYIFFIDKSVILEKLGIYKNRAPIIRIDFVVTLLALMQFNLTVVSHPSLTC